MRKRFPIPLAVAVLGLRGQTYALYYRNKGTLVLPGSGTIGWRE